MKLVYTEKPKQYNPKVGVVSCFVEHQGKILLLLRQDHKPEGNTWAVPAGKIDSDEQPKEALIREIKEELSIDIASHQIKNETLVYVKYPDRDFDYYMYKIALDEKPSIKINVSEHKEYQWLTPYEALQLQLIPGEDECIKLFYNLK